MSDSIRWEQDSGGVVVLTLDAPGASANTMDQAFAEALEATLDRLETEQDGITGVIIASAKKTFFAGADLNVVIAVTPESLGEFGAFLTQIKANLRRLELLGKPVVAVINGAALGGGFEIALAANHRIVVDTPKAIVGFPEVQLGLLPGAGGVTRTVRMLGILPALMGCLLQGQRLRPAQAKELGVVDEIVASPDELLPAARAWITANPAVQKPWDADPKYRIPGGTPAQASFAANLPAFPANLRKQTKGAGYPAPIHIMSAAVEGSQVDFDHALEIETRYFLDLVRGQIAKNMIQAFFFDLNRVTGTRGRPDHTETFEAKKLVVLGAGMMGAAIAYVAAKAGIEVVLKDVSLEAAQHGKQYSETLVAKQVGRGRQSQADGDALLARITPSADPSDADGADMVIEAVFEDPKVKAQVFAEIEPHLAPNALLGSNTSTLPITELAEGVSRAADFIGIHFFSPVDKMPLVELIRGQGTSDETTYRALDFVTQINKTPIVVNDSRGFFTSRVIGTFINEGIAMLAEGVPAATIEQASGQAGYPAPLLQLSDELNLKLMRKIRVAAQAASDDWETQPAEAVIDRMLDEFDRPGRLEGRGFYEYDADGRRTGLWSGLRDAFPPIEDPASLSLHDLEERLMFIEAIEAVRCYEEGVIESVADANIGSIMGIGFPAWSGGVLQFINGYDAGLPGFVARARELAEQFGPRFEPPASLVERAARGERFSDELLTTV
jgi:3-hydroxyacyl-CoA dehydrogenase/enoyl-CoA hydratase/3-hydroxybutyryl-CoA epimerase